MKPALEGVLTMIPVIAFFMVPESAQKVREEFPHVSDAQSQVYRCDDHARYLKWMRGHCGYQDGRWDAWIAEMERHQEMWTELARSDTRGSGSVMCKHLDNYRKLVGEERFMRRWSPPRCPCSIEDWPKYKLAKP